MAAKKPKVKVASIKNVEAANDALFKLARATLKVRKLETDAALKIANIQKQLEIDTAALNTEIEQLDAALTEFVGSHQEELFTEDSKTFEVHFGKFTSRESTTIEIKNAKKTLELLREQKWLDAIKTTESIKKDVLKTYTVENLKLVGCKRETVDILSYAFDEEKAAKATD